MQQFQGMGMGMAVPYGIHPQHLMPGNIGHAQMALGAQNWNVSAGASMQGLTDPPGNSTGWEGTMASFPRSMGPIYSQEQSGNNCFKPLNIQSCS